MSLILDNLIDIPMPNFGSIIPFVLLANLPQAIASFIYLSFNSQFTGMLANREWTQYVIKRAPLRVSIPNDGQRSTSFKYLISGVSQFSLRPFYSTGLFLSPSSWFGLPFTARVSPFQILKIFSSLGQIMLLCWEILSQPWDTLIERS